MHAAGLEGEVSVENAGLFIRYVPLEAGSGYVRPEVRLEFGARATGEPSAPMWIDCDGVPHVPNVIFPRAKPRVMQAERTFWEKATAAHVYCLQGRLRGGRFARHWYDLVALDRVDVVERALVNREIAEAVAAHKAVFFREKDASGNWVDYRVAVADGLELVPAGPPLAALADDYARMVEDGLLLDTADPFDALMNACQSIADRANRPLMTVPSR